MIRRLLLAGLIFVIQVLPLYGRSVLIDPRPARVSFAQKVSTYVHSVHGKTPNEGVGLVLSKAVLLEPAASMKAVTTILNELGPYLMQDKTVAEQEACSASLIKILVPIVTQFEAALFNGIRTIEDALAYWQYQQAYPLSYYFHKSPLKYFTFDQRQEVAEKVQALKAMREQHFELFGRINIHLSSFDGHIPVQEQYVWIQTLCRLLFAYDETVPVADDAEIFPLLYEATTIVAQYKKHMQERFKPYQIPSLVARRWMELTAGVAGVSGGGLYLYTHPAVVTEGQNKMGEYWAYAKGVVFGKSDSTEVDSKYGAYKTKWNGLDSTHESIKKVQAELRRDGGARSDVVGTMMGAYLDIGVEGCRHVVEAFAKIGHAFANGANHAGIAEKFTNYLVPGTGILRMGVGTAAASLSSPAAAAANVEGAEQEKLPFPVSESFHEVYNTGKLWFALQKVEHPRAWALLRSAPFTIPFSIFAWKMSKALYRRYTKLPDCEPIRMALVDIALILNVYGDAVPHEMDVGDFGRLAYLAHKLELDSVLIPKQYRESFLIEVGLLHTSSLNAQQKMKVIDLMYKKYPFLAFQSMITA